MPRMMQEHGAQLTRPARTAERVRSEARGVLLPRLLMLLNTALCALALTVAVEVIARNSLEDLGSFLFSLSRPGFATILMLMVTLLVLDAILGAAYRSLVVLVPPALLLAFLSSQKQLYLSDPLYPSDLLFGRQIMELLPVMVTAEPWLAAAYTLAGLSGLALLAWTIFHWWRRMPPISPRMRMLRLLLLLPVMGGCVPLLKYAEHSWLKDRLGILPMMWDQAENYRHNGFLLAFAFNVPMANVSAPSGYGSAAIENIAVDPAPAATAEGEKPDVIVLMSESLWDPTRLPGVSLSADPMPAMRAHQSGNIFSPEFGGMTANVEFEVLTGFSNAFLPYGSIPYQQYIRRPLPSLATFFAGHGYRTAAIHPFEGWFWNRTDVYEALGFETFWSEENLPPMEKRGIFASDAALTREIIARGESTDRPFFFFAVSLQGHGPYEQGRYRRQRIEVESSLSERAVQPYRTYVEGVRASDDSFAELVAWAKTRERETIIVLFGDHLPPLGPAFVESGFMKEVVASRHAPEDVMRREHETPLIVWSSKTGVRRDLGTISPSLLPFHILDMAGLDHPFYTGLLGRVEARYKVIDRHLLIGRDATATPAWQQGGKPDTVLADWRLLQYDMMFGARHGQESFFPGTAEGQQGGS